MISIANSVLTTRCLTMFVIVLATVSCDTLNEEQISPDKQLTLGEKQFYTVPDSSIFIESFVDATLGRQ